MSTYDLAVPTTLLIPPRYYLREPGFDAAKEVQRLAALLAQGTAALGGCYMRLCHVIRTSKLSDDDVRAILAAYFPPPRVSEILRVSRCPDSVWKRYEFGVFGFKAALRECRGFMVTPSEELRQRKIRRTAERLVVLAHAPMVIELVAWRVTVAGG